jgi:(4S)-4-hydroxy-5-phosphonooxypentane-2,3-dione isomerase
MTHTSDSSMQGACFIVTVLIDVLHSNLAEFQDAILNNAHLTREKEPGCLRFDICVSPANPCQFFLYEIYGQRADFELHLASEHFLHFDKLVAPWIIKKSVQTYDLINP